MHIPFLDLVAQYESIRDELMPAIQQVLDSAQFILGEDVELFEDKFAAFCGADHCVSVSSGTEALHLSLRALGIGPGDEVITAANSFVATAFAIAYTGATPVFVDVDPQSYNIDVNLIEQAVTSRTKAILPVHLYGQPADMDAILSVAHKHGLRTVEDACQAHGAEYQGRRVGALGDAGCFSFYPGKNLGAYGDGGAILTNDRALAQKLRLLRNYGQQTKNQHTMLGYNSRLDTIQAAVLLVKLNHLEEWTEQRRTIAARYRALLSDPGIGLPQEKSGVRHVYHLFVIQHDQRDELIAYLRTRNIFCGIHYPTPLPDAPPLQTAHTVPNGVPVSTSLAQRILSLPIYPELDETAIAEIVDAVKSFSVAKVRV
jgi:dTDP-4-amino-4,6-dideoxygalactose transaminase